jgi:hypothetical protein
MEFLKVREHYLLLLLLPLLLPLFLFTSVYAACPGFYRPCIRYLAKKIQALVRSIYLLSEKISKINISHHFILKSNFPWLLKNTVYMLPCKYKEEGIFKLK